MGAVLLPGSTRETYASFADLICDDPQWLRGKFDALIEAGFSPPPPPPGSPRPAAGPVIRKAVPIRPRSPRSDTSEQVTRQ